MTLHAEIRPGDLESVQRKLAPELYHEATQDFIAKSAKFASEEAQRSAPPSVAHEISAHVDELSAEVRLSGAALAVELGRHIGTPQPPEEALRSWAARHGIGVERVFVIARAIKARGIKGRFFMRRAIEKLRTEEMPRMGEQWVDEVEAKWTS